MSKKKKNSDIGVYWHGDIPFRVSDTKQYKFGFTGFKVEGRWEDDIDEFEAFAREVRKNAGIEDPPPKQKWVPSTKQVLWSRALTIPAPKFHYQIYGITGDQIEDRSTRNTESNNEEVHKG